MIEDSDSDPAARHGCETLISDRAALAATMVVVTGLLVAALAQGRDPWLDESALVTNLLTDNVRSLFEPMRYFEQATTLAHRMLGMWIAQGFQAQAGNRSNGRKGLAGS